MASFLTNRFASDVMKAVHDIPNDDQMCALMKSSHTPDRDSDFMSEVVADECDVVGYASVYDTFATRLTLINATATEDDSGDQGTMDADNFIDANAWQTLSAGNTLGGLWIAKKDTNDAASPLIGFVEFSSPRATDGADFPVLFNTNGIFSIQTNPA